MLSKNYILLCHIVIISIFVFGMVYEFCVVFWGIPQYKSNKNKKAQLYLARFGGIIGMGIVIISYFGLCFPCIQDIPQYLSGSYSITEGTVVEILAELDVEYWKKGEVSIKEDITGEKIEISDIYIPFMRKGTHVKVAYLEHSKMGCFAEIDGENMQKYWITRKGFFIALIILANGYITYYIFRILGNRVRLKKKQYIIWVYSYIYAILLCIMQFAALLGTQIWIGAICGNYNSGMVTAWTCLLWVYFVLIFILFIVGQQRLLVQGENFTYCNFKKKYKGIIKEIAKMELIEKKRFHIGQDEIKLIQLLITMTDGTVLTINDMDTHRNQKFYEKLKNEALIKM